MPLTVWQFDPAQLTPYYNLALCAALADAGCHVRYIASDYLYDHYLPIPTNIEVDYLYFKGLNHKWLLRFPRLRRVLRGISYPLGHRQFLKKLRQTPPDIVHIQWSRLPRFDYPLIQAIQKQGIPVVHTVHDVVPVFDPNSATGLERIYTTVDHLIVHTEANKTDLLARFPMVDAAHVSIVPLIRDKLSLPPDATASMARKKLNLPETAPVLLFFGSIRHNKGLDILATAFPRIQQHYPDAQLLIAGRPETAAEIALLEALRSQTGILIRDVFIPYHEMWLYHLAADVVVFPYRHIYQSAALITAMGFGCPVVVTNVGGLPETIDGNGKIVPPEDSSALAEAILEMLRDKSQLFHMGQKSRELVATHHDNTPIANLLINIYKARLTVYPKPLSQKRL